MATAGEIITDALQEINVQEDEQSIQNTDFQAGLRYLNRMVNEWAARGMSLGFTTITKISEQVTVPDGVLGAIVSNLAIRLAPQFDVAIPIELAATAKDGMDAVRHLTVGTEATQMPGTMPIGSGNEGYRDGFTRRKFYPGVDPDTVDDEANRNIQQETNT